MAVAVAERKLTDRQLDCLALMARDMRPVAIASRLNFSKRTVENELDAIREFYGVSTRSGAVVKAIWNGDLVFLETGEVSLACATEPASL